MSRDPLRVCIDVSAIPERPAGAGRYVVELVRSLSTRSDVEVVVTSRRGDVARWQLTGASSVLVRAPVSTLARLVYGEFQLGRALRHEALDVFHGPHYTLPQRLAFPAVVTAHDLTLIEHPEWHERSKALFFARALRVASRRADVVVVPSEFVASAFRRHFGDKVSVRVVPHGVDHARFRPDEPTRGADRAAMTRHRVERPFILAIGTLEPRKNLPRLVEAFALLANSKPDLRLVLAGAAGWKSESLDEAIARSGVAQRIDRLGYVSDEDLPALLRSASAVAYPSLEEGFGLPALEALACGAPLVTTKASAMAEVTGDAALLIDAASVRELAGALEAVIDDTGATASRRLLGIERAKPYTWIASAALHLDAYGLAVATATARRPGLSA